MEGEREREREREREGRRKREETVEKGQIERRSMQTALYGKVMTKNKSAKHKLGNNNNYHIIMTHTAKSYSIIIIKY